MGGRNGKIQIKTIISKITNPLPKMILANNLAEQDKVESCDEQNKIAPQYSPNFLYFHYAIKIKCWY